MDIHSYLEQTYCELAFHYVVHMINLTILLSTESGKKLILIVIHLPSLLTARIKLRLP